MGLTKSAGEGADAELPADEPAEEVQHPTAGNSRSDLASVIWLGFPTCLNLFCIQLPGLALLAFLGDNTDQLAAAGVGFMYSNISGYSLIVGTGGGAQPLISQAFGANNYRRCGDLLQQQFAIHAILCLPIAAMWWWTEDLLIAIGQPAKVAALTGDFMRWRLLGLPFLALREDMMYYLLAQRVMKMPMVLSVVLNLLTIVLYPILIGSMGFGGAPLAMTLENACQAILLVVLGKFALPDASSWPVWNLKTALAWSGWLDLLRLAWPSAVLMLSEWWGWEVNLFFAGMLCGRDAEECVELDVFPIASNTMVMGFMCHWGYSVAAGTMVGNALGAGDAVQARRIATVTLQFVGMLAGVIAVALLVFREKWAALFTTDETVLNMTREVLPYVAAYIFLDALGPGFLGTVLRSMGVVKAPAAMTFISFYIVGLPSGLWRTFGPLHMGIHGLWGGLVLAMLVMVVTLLAYMYGYVDWGRTAEEAQTRSQAVSVNPSVQDPPAGAERRVPSSVVGKSAKYLKVADEVELEASA